MSYINWTKYGIKINLKMGANIDNCYTDEPFVLKNSNSTYKMWYNRYNGIDWKICYTISLDGIN